MKSNPFISIVIPCYNSGAFINNCLDCIKNQTSKDFEVIFVDDGSTDNTLKMINDFACADKKVISTTHQGPAQARNIALKHVSGEYTWFVDSDDLIDYSAVEIITNYLKNSKPDVLRFKHKINNNNSITLGLTPFSVGIYEDKTLFDIQRYAVGYANAAPFFLWLHVYKTELIKDIPLLSLWDYLSESNSFNQRIYPRIKKFHVVDDVLYQYNIRPGSASFVHRPVLDKTINLYKALKEDFMSIGIYENYKDMIAFSIVDNLMLGFCMRDRGTIITEYAYCSSIETAHSRVKDILNSLEFDELINNVSKLKTSPLLEKAHSILLKKDERRLFEFLSNLNSYRETK